MYSSLIYEHIFETTVKGQGCAALYARSGQEDICVEWLYRHSPRLAIYMGYLRVTQSAVDACLFLNGLVDELLVSVGDTICYPLADEDYLDRDTMMAISFLAETIPNLEDVFMEAFLTEITNSKYISPDSAHLIPYTAL